jgi:tetratricopeptide (TPR) repeat protein
MRQSRSSTTQLDQSLLAAPRDAKLVVQLAQSYFRSGQTDKIAPLCENYLTQSNLSANDMIQIAQLYVAMNDADRALTTLQKVIATYPQEAQAYYAVALIRSVQRNTDDAFKALEKSIQLSASFGDRAKNDPQLANIRGDPRFQKLVRP